jgi:4a-hydroxytetrahydrobiopterin dehydratase
MPRPPVLAPADIDAWLAAHPAWALEGGELVRAFAFPDFSKALAFVVRVGLFAERTDHHPEISLGWGKACLRFSTHDPKGLTQLDLAGAEAADQAHDG